ncbi:hypothetical protein ACHAWF_017232 [Thalassiosira exigua]
MTGQRRSYQHGTAIDPDQVRDDAATPDEEAEAEGGGGAGKGLRMSDLFVTMCFFARLGFVQPPCCLRCAYRSAGCGEDEGDGSSPGAAADGPCGELVPWRRDAGIPLHPDMLEGNVVFVTCTTAKSLVNGDAYPSIRWDTRNRRLLHEI